MKITIITVCFNAIKELKKTVNSVLSQTYQDVEYILEDGGSTDGTAEFVSRLRDERVHYFIEPDHGIYNAMNRALSRATGDYICFINAGDIIADDTTIEKVAALIGDERATIYYGSIVFMRPDGSSYKRCLGPDSKDLRHALSIGDMPSHQAIIAPRRALISRYFNESYSLRADYNWLYSCYAEGERFEEIPITICVYDGSGASSLAVNGVQMQEETERIIRYYRRINPDILDKDDMMDQIAYYKRSSQDNYVKYRILEQWMELNYRGNRIGDYLLEQGYHSIAIYGASFLGVRLLKDLIDTDIDVRFFMDKKGDGEIEGVKVVYPEQCGEEIDVIIVSVISSFKKIKEMMKEITSVPIVSLEEVILTQLNRE